MTEIEADLRNRFERMSPAARIKMIDYFGLSPKSPNEVQAILDRLALSMRLQESAGPKRTN